MVTNKTRSLPQDRPRVEGADAKPHGALKRDQAAAFAETP
jgi:hypothetical protein